tara:strand:+ start:209 stop:631 length:423 start_codon:yes stop_codon:yes gene_type:complete
MTNQIKTGIVNEVYQQGIFQQMNCTYVTLKGELERLRFYCKSSKEEKNFPYKIGTTISYKLTSANISDSEKQIHNLKSNAQLIREPLQKDVKPYNKNVMPFDTMCLSYAKDLVVAGKTTKKNMFSEAEEMLNWVNNQRKN